MIRTMRLYTGHQLGDTGREEFTMRFWAIDLYGHVILVMSFSSSSRQHALTLGDIWLISGDELRS